MDFQKEMQNAVRTPQQAAEEEEKRLMKIITSLVQEDYKWVKRFLLSQAKKGEYQNINGHRILTYQSYAKSPDGANYLHYESTPVYRTMRDGTPYRSDHYNRKYYVTPQSGRLLQWYFTSIQELGREDHIFFKLVYITSKTNQEYSRLPVTLVDEHLSPYCIATYDLDYTESSVSPITFSADTTAGGYKTLSFDNKYFDPNNHVVKVSPSDTTNTTRSASSSESKSEKFDNLSDADFTAFIVKLLKRRGYSIDSPGSDSSCPITASRDEIRYAVFCCNAEYDVNVMPIENILTLPSYSDPLYNVRIIATNQQFTLNARKLAKQNNIVLWNRATLICFLSNKHYSK